MKLKLRTSSIIIILFLLCLMSRNSYSQQNMNGWYWLNSQPQSNDLNWVKIIDATHIYAVGNNGTFMRSTDAGDTWLINSQAGINETSFGSGGTMRLNTAWFFDANTGIVAGLSASGDGGKIRRTTDGGMTFNTIGLGLGSGSSNISDIYFINSSTGYLCGNNSVKIMKTTNSGLNWSIMPNLPVVSYTYKSIFAKNENEILLGVSFNGIDRNILRTTNAGGSWKLDTLPGTTGMEVKAIEFQDANTGFLAGLSNPNYFAFTTNGGSNWTETVFPNKQYPIYGIQVIGSTVYALGASFKSYFYTSDLGVTWDSVIFDDPSNLYQPDEFYVYAFDINGNDAIVVGANGKLNISNDGGNTWRNKNYSVDGSQYSFHSIYAKPGTGNVWTGSDYGGLILYSSNSGANWTKQQTTAQYAFYDIQFVNSSTGYAVGGNLFNAKGYCYKTVNSGLNWTALTISSPHMQRIEVDFVDANTGWIVGGNPSNGGCLISKTTNGGNTWIEQSTTPLYNTLIGHIDMYDANTGYIGTDDNLWKTTNGGTNWNKVNTLTSGLLWTKVQTFSPSALYLGGNQRIYKSFDSGLTWSSVSIPSALPNIANMDWWDMDNGIVTGTDGYTAKTSDGGLTWTERDPGSSTISGVSMASKDTVFATCDRNVYGAVFRLVDSNPYISLNLKTGIEGFWNGATQVSDTVKCHFRNSVAPYNEVDVASAVLDNSGNGTFTFPSAPSGSYYLVITHRNSIETWSALPKTVSQGGNYNYDFTTSASQAFGNNLVLKSGRYCNYSGDVNQSGEVNLSDLIETNNATAIFLNGYIPADINGDNFTDLTDLTKVYNNASIFVVKITP